MIQLGEHVFAVAAGASYVYIWQHDGRLTLIDSGAAGSEPAVLAAIGAIGHDSGDLTRIVLTHWHHDHCGGALALVRRTGARVCAGRADAPVIRGEEEGAPAVLTAAEKPLMARLAGLMPPAPACPVDDELEEGDGLPTAEGGQDAAVVLALPGHTPGSIAVHLPGERVILTGDLIANFDGRITLGPFNTDREQARESVLRLAALDVEAAGFGHGEPITRNASAVLADWIDVFA